MNILVTGAAGYLGVGICRQLAREGHRILAFDNLMYDQWHLVHQGLKHSNIEFVKYDCKKLPSTLLAKANVIIPLAAIVGAPACDKKVEESQAINVSQLRWIKENLSKDQLIIYPNSNSGLGSVEGIADENAPRNAVSLYGRQKDDAEDIVREHPNSIVFRLATVFGVSWRTRTDLLVNTLVKEALFSHNDIEIFDPDFRRNFIHVEDIATAFCFAVTSNYKMKGQVYNLGNDFLNTTKFNLASKVAYYTECKVVVKEGHDPDKRNYEVSSKKLMDLGWKPYRDLDYGIKELIHFYNNLPTNPSTREEILRYTRNV